MQAAAALRANMHDTPLDVAWMQLATRALMGVVVLGVLAEIGRAHV